MKRCPFCAEEIQDEAIKCKHCGEMIGQQNTTETKTAGMVCPRCLKVHVMGGILCPNCLVPLVKVKGISPQTSKANEVGVTLTCPRCGHKDDPTKFENAYSGSACFCLAILMVLPAILYYFFRQGKKICPKCGNVF